MLVLSFFSVRMKCETDLQQVRMFLVQFQVLPLKKTDNKPNNISSSFSKSLPLSTFSSLPLSLSLTLWCDSRVCASGDYSQIVGALLQTPELLHSGCWPKKKRKKKKSKITRKDVCEISSVSYHHTVTKSNKVSAVGNSKTEGKGSNLRQSLTVEVRKAEPTGCPFEGGVLCCWMQFRDSEITAGISPTCSATCCSISVSMYAVRAATASRHGIDVWNVQPFPLVCWTNEEKREQIPSIWQVSVQSAEAAHVWSEYICLCHCLYVRRDC